MPVTSGLSTTAKSGQSYFRITSPSFKTNNPTDHVKVVNGEGSLRNPHGARYNYPGAVTAYLTEDIETCLAEKMFYFHRETLRAIDISHHTGVIPPFSKTFVLWEIKFQNDVNDIFDMTVRNAHTSFNIFPSLSINPSQDYEHLKAKRAHIQSDGYNGIRVPSSRTTNGGNMVVLFHDQSRNVQQIRAYDVSVPTRDPSGSSI
jgi:RES domain-containing protein